MHRLAYISVANFKSIRESALELAPFTPLVGYNNAGKTSYLQAIQWLLRRSTLTADVFNDPTSPVSVEGVIEGISADVLSELTEAHRKAVEPYVRGGQLRVKRSQAEPSCKASDIKLLIWSENEDGGEWKASPTGIDAAMNKLFPEPIFIGAMENAAEDTGKVTQRSTIGQLLQQFIKPLQEKHDASIHDALSLIRSTFDAEGDGKAEELLEADRLLTQEVGSFFQGVELKVHIPAPDIDVLLKSGTIKVYDHNGESGRSVEHMGHGTQRSIQMALIKCLAEKKSTNSNSTTMLLIDEPELYLHPQAVIQVRTALKKLSGNGYQVAFSTHSPIMIGTADIPSTAIVRKYNDSGTTILVKNRSGLDDVLKEADTNIEHLFSLQNTSQFLFSNKALLLEGKTEKRVLPDIFKALHNAFLEEKSIASVPVNGSGGLPVARLALKHLGVTSFAVADLDFAFKEAPKHGLLDANDPDLLACKVILSQIAADNGIALGEDGLPRRGNGQPASYGFEVLASFPDHQKHIRSIHEKLKAQGFWVWTLGAIEKHLGIEGKSAAQQLAFTKKLYDDGPAAIGDVESLREMFAWVQNT